MSLSKLGQKLADIIVSKSETAEYYVDKTKETFNQAFSAGKDAWNGEHKHPGVDLIIDPIDSVEGQPRKWRVVHYYYGKCEGEVWDAERVLAALHTVEKFNLYAIVSFSKGIRLERNHK